MSLRGLGTSTDHKNEAPGGSVTIKGHTAIAEASRWVVAATSVRTPAYGCPESSPGAATMAWDTAKRPEKAIICGFKADYEGSEPVE